MRYLTIDPGVSGMSVVAWDTEWLYPIDIHLLNKKASFSWEENAVLFTKEVVALCTVYKPTCLYIEFPRHFSSAFGDMAANKGDIIKLAFMVGMLAEVCREMGAEFVPVPVNDWKGQLSKEIVTKRILKRLPQIEDRFHPKSHSWDAIGIGLYVRDKIL